MARIFFTMGSLFAGLGVALGAFGAHALRDRLTADLLAIFETGVRYQMYHSLGLFAVVLALTLWPTAKAASIAGWLFAVGILVFSGSLYILAITDLRWLGAITPLGGVAFIAGWICLLLVAWRR